MDAEIDLDRDLAALLVGYYWIPVMGYIADRLPCNRGQKTHSLVSLSAVRLSVNPARPIANESRHSR